MLYSYDKAAARVGPDRRPDVLHMKDFQRLKTFFIGAIIAAVAASGATYYRYGTFDPCDWMEQDLAKQSGLPRLVAKAKVRAELLIDGVTQPDFGQCTLAWWKFRADEVQTKTGG